MLSGMKNGVITKEMLPGKIVVAFEEGNVLPKRRDQIKGYSFRTLLHEKAEKLLSRSVNLADGNKKSGA